ncbi:hypothetical protein EVAR_22015_1 [Eumeta japonica]|uniref:MADF domain-containing protein n=1 Tax=Eumeta variegata TaxID=151549 RepID=A0A4C1YYS0_EUMVA|nr:hypothetical protein EVAR_22015_1 [Eumeta japonica]
MRVVETRKGMKKKTGQVRIGPYKPVDNSGSTYARRMATAYVDSEYVIHYLKGMPTLESTKQIFSRDEKQTRALTTSELEELLEIIDEGYWPSQPLPAQPTIEDYVRHKLQSSGRVCNCCNYHTHKNVCTSISVRRVTVKPASNESLVARFECSTWLSVFWRILRVLRGSVSTLLQVVPSAQKYREEKVLWNPAHPEHYNKLKKEDAWNRLASLLDSERQTCKNKTTSLLASLRREKQKTKQSTSTGKSADEVYHSTWFAYKAMIFLLDRNTPRATTDTLREREGASEQPPDDCPPPANKSDNECPPPANKATMNALRLPIKATMIALRLQKGKQSPKPGRDNGIYVQYFKREPSKRSQLRTNLTNVKHMVSESIEDRSLKCLIDTGASISIIKIETLHPETKASSKEILNLKGISDSEKPMKTLDEPLFSKNHKCIAYPVSVNLEDDNPFLSEALKNSDDFNILISQPQLEQITSSFKCTNRVNNTEKSIGKLYKLYGSLSHLTATKRMKRGWFDGIGSVMKTVFGTLDSDDAVYYDESIEKVLKDDEHIYKLMKNQIRVTQTAINLLPHRGSYMNQAIFS